MCIRFAYPLFDPSLFDIWIRCVIISTDIRSLLELKIYELSDFREGRIHHTNRYMRFKFHEGCYRNNDVISTTHLSCSEE